MKLYLLAAAVILLMAACELQLPPKQSPYGQASSGAGEESEPSDADASDTEISAEAVEDGLIEEIPGDAGGEKSDLPSGAPAPQITLNYAEDAPLQSTTGPMPARPRGTLFFDDFSDGFTDYWEYEFNAPEEEPAGNPSLSLKLPARTRLPQVTSSGEGGPRMGGVPIGKSSDVKITTAVEPFSVTNGLSVSFEVKIPEAPEDYLGSLYFSLREQDETYPNAAFTISSNKLSYSTRIPYSSTREDRSRSATGPMIRDTKWHKFELSIDADGTAKWKKDGVTKLTGYVVPGDYVLEIRASPARVTETKPYYYLLDNVLVRSLEQAPAPQKQAATQGTTQTTYSSSGKGTLSVSGDNGYLYLGNYYIGQGRAVVTAGAGSYTLTSVSPSTGNNCWQRSVRIDSGKTTTVKIDSWCR